MSQDSQIKTLLKCHQTYPDNEDPFDERQAEATDGAIAPRNGVGQTEGETEADPVEEEGHWREQGSALAQQPHNSFHSQRR